MSELKQMFASLLAIICMSLYSEAVLGKLKESADTERGHATPQAWEDVLALRACRGEFTLPDH